MITLHIFDLDGTLCDRDSDALLPGVAEWFATHPNDACAIATNQGGVGLRRWMETGGFGEPNKYPTQAQVEDRMAAVETAIAHHRSPPDIYVAFAYQAKSGAWSPIPPDGQDDPRWLPGWRKPNPGMILQAMSDAGISDPAQVLLVGDREEDRQTAEAAGVGFQWAWEFFDSAARIRPAKPKTPVPVCIGTDGNIISATFPEAFSPFIAACQERGMKWNAQERRWEREITRWAGPVDDRLVELGVHLVAVGFVVDAPSPVIRERIAAQDYQPEQTRWVLKRTTGHFAGYYQVQWGKNESFARHLRTLPGIKVYDRQAFLPADYYAEVLDFAQTHGFQLSDGALAMAEEARAAYESAYIVGLQKPSADRPSAPVRAELTPDEFGIDEELLDYLADNDPAL